MQEYQQYDRALKSLLRDEAAEILPGLVEGVTLLSEQNIEIDRSTLRTDLVYKEKVAKSEERGETRGAQKIVTTLVEVRFPELAEVAQERIGNIRNIDMLNQLAKQISTAKDEQTALWVLNSYAA